MKIGFIGLGHMGKPMAKNLVKAGFALKVYDFKQSAMDELTALGAVQAADGADAATDVDAVITMVPADKDILALYGDDGILTDPKPGMYCIDMTSAKGITKQKIAQHLKETGKNVQFIDAPVSGGVPGAEAGTLTIMVGSTKEQFDELQDVFGAMGKKIYYTGEVGCGSNIKMLNQVLNGANAVIAAEVLCMSRKLGIDDKILYDVVTQSSGNSFVFEKNVPKYMMTGDHTPGFRLDLMKKDISLYIDSANELNQFSPVADLVYQLYRAVSNQGNDGKCYTYIYEWMKGNQK